jgi:mannosyl-3-phosphoglycerate phosphatase
MFSHGSDSLQDIQPALDLVLSRDIPLIPTCEKTPEQVFAVVDKFDKPDPFIVECGGAIYIPKRTFNIGYNYQRISRGHRVIEFGTPRAKITERLSKIRSELDFQFDCLTELTDEDVARSGISLNPEDRKALCCRNHSEVIFFEGNHSERKRFEVEIGNTGLRIKDHDEYLIITGDHDEGTAVRFLIQLYREEFEGTAIKTIGLGSNWMDSPMLYAVDTPVLVRKPNGRFDGRVGKRGLKFTNDIGPVGWKQAVIALLTEENNQP